MSCRSFLYLFASYMAEASGIALTDLEYCDWVRYVHFTESRGENKSIFLLWALFLEQEGISLTVRAWNEKHEN